MMTDLKRLEAAVIQYCTEIRRLRDAEGLDNEPALYAPLRDLLQAVLAIVRPTEKLYVDQFPQTSVGTPDFVIADKHGPLGYVEAEKIGTNLDNPPKGHPLRQKETYLREYDAWIYTNFHVFILFHRQKEIARVSLLPKDVLDPHQDIHNWRGVIDPRHLEGFYEVLDRFLSISPRTISSTPELAQQLARAARRIKRVVLQRLEECIGKGEDSPLVQLYEDYKNVLYSHLTAEEFADTAAQTLTYGALLSHLAQPDLFVDKLSDLPEHIEHDAHKLLRQTLKLFTNEAVQEEMGWAVDSLRAIINRAKYAALGKQGKGQPILFFYEDFLQEYDPQKRKELGVYYTPDSVVLFQVRAIDYLLETRFNKQLGFADEDVDVLDPACGTGMYLYLAAKVGVEKVRKQLGERFARSALIRLFKQLRGFEIMIGPYTVAHWRLASYMRSLKAKPSGRIQVFLTDTLDPSHTEPVGKPHVGFFGRSLEEERKDADEVKANIPIMVIFGNPPWKRGKKPPPNFKLQGRKKAVNWVADYLLQSFKENLPPEFSKHLKSLHDPYVYFYRWSIWKLMEQENATKRGIITFISSRSFLKGEAFAGMRRELRRHFDTIYVLDLHGDQREALPADIERDENIFPSVQRGSTICICVADGTKGSGEDAKVYYREKWGTRKEKEQFLKNTLFEDLFAEDAVDPLPGSGIDPFVPPIQTVFKNWPLLSDLFEQFYPGVQVKRMLPIGFTKEDLKAKLQEFLSIPIEEKEKRSKIFKDTDARKADKITLQHIDESKIIRYTYRALDRRFLYNDKNFIDRPRPQLQKLWGSENLAIYTIKRGHGEGPAVFLVPYLPDMDAFRGSFSGYAFPLWDNREESGEERLIKQPKSNLKQSVIQALARHYNAESLKAEDVFAYCYALLFCRLYTLKFAKELQQSLPAVPFTQDYRLFQELAVLGKKLIELHSFKSAFPARHFKIQGDKLNIEEPRFEKDKIFINEKTSVAPVSREAWEFSVSGYPILQRWLEKRKGYTLEELELVDDLFHVIWALEQTIALEPNLNSAFIKVIEGSSITKDQLGITPAS